VLTVGLTTNTAETVAFYNTLETTALRGAYRIDEVAFNEHVLNTKFFAKLCKTFKLNAEVAKLNNISFGCCVSFF
jgi:hypothetical protein